MENNTGQGPSIRDLRHGAQHELAQAAIALVGQPGMSTDEQAHALSHAKLALARATLLLEQALHTILVRNASEHMEAKVSADVASGVASIEAMLAAKTNTTTTPIKEEEDPT